MRPLALILILSGMVYADNNDLFNQAYQAGKQNNFNMNLNSGSTIDSYGQVNHFESTVANNANAGTTNSRDMYDHVYGADGVSQDPNYLYNQGSQDIASCQSKTDPRCTTLNKYGDKDTQAQLQAYSQGLSQKYSIQVAPDPVDSSCSMITHKVPINQSTVSCISSAKEQSACSTIVTPYNNYVPPNPTDGTILASGSNKDTSRTYCGIAAKLTSYEALTKGSQIQVEVTSRDDDGGWNSTKTFNYGMNAGGTQFVHQNDNNGSTNKTMNGTVNYSSCTGNNCQISFTTSCSHGQLGGNDWNVATTLVLNYTMPTVSSRDIGYTMNDTCSNQKSASSCKLVNYQCLDNTPTKTIDGQNFNLSDMCSKYGLSGSNCCWNSQANYYCSNLPDTCGPYRKNSNCSLLDNTCINKDYISGQCNEFQSKYSCAGGYQDVESRVCTNVVCATTESATAAKCYNPPQPSAQNVNNMGAVIAYMQLAQNMAQDMQCSDIKDPSTCTIFSGTYFNCYMYMFKADQPGSWNNNGADCMINHEFFTQAGVPTGYSASDHNLYSQATSGTNNVMGAGGNYSLSSDDSRAINNTVKLQQQSQAPAVNQDENINYTPNNSSNQSMAVNNGQVVSVTINKDTIKDVSGFSAFKSYLTDKSVNLAWNRQKSEPNPNNIKNITFSDEQMTRVPRGRPFGWNSGTSQPVINGLCIHLADSCEGGDDSATSSDLIKGELAWAGGFTNPNFCAHCTSSLFGACLTAEPRNVKQEWCCFTSKASMDINLAAYDQGLLDFYTGDNSRYGAQVNHPNDVCGGVTVGMVSQIDFSKGNYFDDLVNSIDVDSMIDSTSFTNPNVQNNTYGRSNTDAGKMVNDYLTKQ